MKNAVILYNKLSDDAKADEADVLDEVNHISKMFTNLGLEHSTLEFSLNMQEAHDALLRLKPSFVFNLVESVDNKGSLIYLAPALLTSLNIPYTGGSAECTFLTSSKIIAKEYMAAAKIPTAQWYNGKGNFTPQNGKSYIVKPIWEDGSLGLDENSVFCAEDIASRINSIDFNQMFVEEYIDGREFNISILAGKNGPEVLPPAEIIFDGYDNGKLKVVGYTAKWLEDSFEYKHTYRTFNFNPNDSKLLKELHEICLQCWDLFGVKGYARVDFRVDGEGRPWVLEVNVNPCISPDSGFVAACGQANISMEQVVERITQDLNK